MSSPVFPSYRGFKKMALGPHIWAMGDLSLPEWLHADKITRPLMAVLLPKATITHDCTDMEF